VPPLFPVTVALTLGMLRRDERQDRPPLQPLKAGGHDDQNRMIEYRQARQSAKAIWPMTTRRPGKRPGILVAHEWNGCQEYMHAR